MNEKNIKIELGDNAVLVENLQKSFNNGDVQVLRDISFKVKRGTILALLGPNGAGKTTTVRILSTLLQPSGGQAFIHGYNVSDDPDGVRANIGLTGQFAAVDEYLTGEENIKMVGRLYRMSNEDIDKRTKDLLEQFDLVEASTRPVKTYSGGMKRRIDLAMSLISSPPIIFLDEPTTGLDPRSRLTMWTIIKNLAKEGTTILLTTQHMDEADNLADRVIVIDNGHVIAEGTSSDLKTKVGADRLEVTVSPDSDFDKAQKLVEGESKKVDADGRTISITTKDGVADLKRVLQILSEASIHVSNVSLHRPTLDDVFLTLTGHTTNKEANIENK